MSGGASILNRTMDEVNLMQRHIEMLKVTKEFQPVGIIRLSEILGIPKHKVRYSLRMLEQEGLIIATSDGARVSDKYEDFMNDLPGYLDGLVERVNRVRSEVPK
jgi:predicted transcriptional regulator